MLFMLGQRRFGRMGLWWRHRLNFEGEEWMELRVKDGGEHVVYGVRSLAYT
jgi:hypothetical protein